MISSAQVAIALCLTLCSLANGFSPNFSTPRQCSSLSISWTSIELSISPVALSEITLSLIPLDNNPAHFVPEPCTVAVPCSGAHAEGGQIEIPRLPFPAGTQFFASAYIPGASGPVRRTVSKVFTVEHSFDRTCLKNIATPTLDKRAKSFGMKRQVSVLGVSSVSVTPGDSTSAAADPSATTTSTSDAAAAPPINVIGVSSVPATDAVPASTSSAAPDSTGAAPPIIPLGTSQIPASSGVDTPGNVAPAPSPSGPVPAIQVIGTSLATVTSTPVATASPSDSAFIPNFITGAGSDAITDDAVSTEPPVVTETTTSCTDAPTETPTILSLQAEDTSTMTSSMMDDGNDTSDEQPYTSDLPGVDSYYTTTSEDISPADVATSTGNYYDDSSVVTYSSFDGMVDAANSMFHAWNPYKPAYTPST